MEIFKKFWILILILLLAAVLRFWNLPNNPPGLTWDEAALGYNAYSIFQTGKDEYGNLLPLTLKSFGDFKPAFYAYLDIPFVATLGLNELAVRLPSAIFGVLGILGIFLLTQKLFKNIVIALLAAFFLSISPWHIQFSRPAFEASIALTFNIFGAYFFLKGLERKKFFIWSALIFGLSLLTYQASKLFVPLLILSLLLIFKKEYKLTDLKIPLTVSVLFIILMGWIFLSGQTGRLSTQNFFAYQRSQDEINLISKEDNLNDNSLPFQILHGEWWAYTKGLFERYFTYFSPKMLFIDGDYSERHRVPDLGALYFFSMIIIPIGLINLVNSGGKNSALILWWMAISPLPAVFSRDLISILRALNLGFPITILEGVGAWIFFGRLMKFGKLGILGIFILSIVIVFNFSIYLDRYFIHAPKGYSKYWLYGQKQIYDFVKNENMDFGKYSKVVITDTFGQPYIYYLFYTKYSPEKFQEQAILDQLTSDVGTIRKIDNIEFRHIFWPKDRGEKNALFIGSLEELPDKDTLPFKEFMVIRDFDFLNGEKALRIVETQ